MSLFRLCCPGCNETPCECTPCAFATSYLLSNLTLSGSYTKTWKGTLCGECTGEEESELPSLSVSINAYQELGNYTLTRGTGPSGGCCYKATGTMKVEYTVNIGTSVKCCQSGQTLGWSDTWTGTKDVTFCHIVIPDCDAQGDCVWRHITQLCDFDIGEHDYLWGIDSSDCLGGLDPENPPLRRARFRLQGGVWMSTSPMVDLDTLGNFNYTQQGFCNPTGVWDCTTGDGSVSCLPHQNGIPLDYGIFSMSLGGTVDHGECWGIAPSVELWAWRTDCAGAILPGLSCYADVDWEGLCCKVEANFGYTNPTYT